MHTPNTTLAVSARTDEFIPTMFPSTATRVLSACIHFLGLSIITPCLLRRISLGDGFSFRGFKGISWARLFITLVLLDSWLFVFTSGIFTFGIGLEASRLVCEWAINICIGFYCTSKFFIYFFLIERVHIVCSHVGARRFRSPLYLFCFVTVLLYSVIVALLLIGKIHDIRADGVCVVGLKPLASVPVLTYDLFINVLLTSLFIRPLFKAVSPRLKRITRRTFIASLVALTTSCINFLVLTILHGTQLAWICIGSCGTDVIVNALALFWITGRSCQTGNDATEDSISISEIPHTSQPSTPHLFATTVNSSGGPSHLTTILFEEGWQDTSSHLPARDKRSSLEGRRESSSVS